MNKVLLYYILFVVFGVLFMVFFGLGWHYVRLEETLLGMVFGLASGWCVYKMVDEWDL